MLAPKKTESKVLDRVYLELSFEDRAGSLTRKEAIAEAAKESGVSEENVGLVRIEGNSGTKHLTGKFYVYGSAESMKRLHPRHLGERALTHEERDKLKQDRKKAKAPVQAPAQAKK